MNVTFASAERQDGRASISSPSSRTTPVARSPRVRIRATGASVRISAPSARAARGDRERDAARAALGDAPRPERAVDLAHVVVQQDVGGAGRADALVGADDPGGRHRRLERVRLEPLVEEVRGAHRHELDEDRLLALGKLLERAREAGERHERPGVEARRVGRDDAQDRLDEPCHLDHELAVLLVRLGIRELRPAAQLADGPAVVVDAPQVVAVDAGRERAVEGQDVEAVARQLELADDLGSQEPNDVARDREAEPRDDLLGHRRATEDVPAFEDDRTEAGAGKVGRGDEPVVARPR